MAGLNCEIRWETRLCEVDGELGYFHCWEHWSNVEVKVDLSATPTAELVDQLSRAVQIPKHALRGGRV